MSDKPWYHEAVFFELNVRAYVDSDGDGNGDFRGVITRLDYIRSLGVDCIWVQPMYMSPWRDGGYDISDYTDIHPDFGTIDDFRNFLDEAHARGLRVVIDLVMNHCSDQHPWFQGARAAPNTRYRDYFVWSDTTDRYTGARIIFLDTETSNWAWDDVAKQYYWHRFYSHQPDLNYDNPEVHEEMFRIVRFWLDMGIDGFRADAVPYLYEREGTNCENLPETHDFLKKLRRMMDEEYPGRVLIAEANQWPHDLLPYFGDGDEFHVCFHFPIMPRMFMALKAADKRPIVNILADTPPIPPGTQWMTFLRNHDELTLEMVTDEERDWMWAHYAADDRARLNLGIRRRLLPLLEGDKRRWLVMNAMFLSVLGTPILYYGDEIGMGDNIWLEDRDGVRTPMQWTDAPNAGFSTSRQTYLPVIEKEGYDYRHVNVAAQEGDPDSYLSWTRFLVATRQSQPSLRSGTREWVETGDVAVLAYWRRGTGDPVLCVFNLSDSARPAGIVPEREMRDLLSREGRVYAAGQPIELAPYAALWLV